MSHGKCDGLSRNRWTSDHFHVADEGFQIYPVAHSSAPHFTSVVLNLCYSEAFELQLPETPVRTAGGESFWELQSKTPE